MGGGGDHAKYRSNQRKNSNYNRLFGWQIETPEITVELGGGGGGSPPLPLPPPPKKKGGGGKKRAGSFCVLEWFLVQSKKIKYFLFYLYSHSDSDDTEICWQKWHHYAWTCSTSLRLSHWLTQSLTGNLRTFEATNISDFNTNYYAALCYVIMFILILFVVFKNKTKNLWLCFTGMLVQLLLVATVWVSQKCNVNQL